MEKTLVVIVLFFWVFQVNSQSVITVSANQSEQLVTHTGPNADIRNGVTYVLGESPLVTGGDPPYSVQWQINDSIISFELNPQVNPDNSTTYVLYVSDNKHCMAKDSIVLTVLSTRLSNIDDTEIIIYPNPASEHFRLDYSGGQAYVMLLDFNGNCLWTRPIKGSTLFDVPYESGEYLIKIIEDNKVVTRKLIILK